MSDVQLSDLVNYTLSRGGSEKSLAFWRILDSF
jgi:hypothetical protein